MKKPKIQLIATLFALAMVTGCSTVKVTKTAVDFYEPTTPGAVQILGTVPPDAKYDQIGIVNANVFGSPETAYNQIREKAAAVGADAVFLNNQMPMGSRVIITGTAVKMKQ